MPSFCVEYIKILSLFNHSYISVLSNSLSWSTDDLFGLRLDSFTISIRVVKCFKAWTYAYLAKTFMTQNNKYLTLLFLEDNDSISAKCAAKVLSVNLAQTILFLNFLITGLCNSSTSFSFTLTPDLVF